ncbi:MAG: hypothetical protein EOP52_04585 [Sphingobacteriales bacterium]|nr:MAG: hypothetical protein EOP52_04585 [Sphingobacteriales bacterium]
MYKILSLASAAVLLAASLSSCRKENGIDNNQVILRPYSLFVSDSAGGLSYTNDGQVYRNFFRTDGTADRGILVSGNNLLWAKSNLQLSENMGAFNPTYRELPYAPDAKWSSMMLRSDAHARIYVASRVDPGVAFSEDNGKSWIPDTSSRINTDSKRINTFAQLDNGLLWGYDNKVQKAYVKFGKTIPWAALGGTSLPTSADYQLTSYGNTLVAYDYSGQQGAWYTIDTGRNWSQFGGIPAGKRLRSAVVPFGQNLLLGTDDGEIYRLDNGTFVLSNEGIERGSIVRSMAFKSDVYKGDNGSASREIRYVYAATSNGLYRSEDNGVNWVKMAPGNFQNLY